MEAGFDQVIAEAPSGGWHDMVESLTRETHLILEKAEQVALRYTGGQRTGVRHVAYVIFCDDPIGPRMAWATGWTDVRALQADLDRLVLSAAPSQAPSGAEDEVVALLKIAQSQQSEPGPIGIGELIMALFDDSLNLAPVLEQSGLTVEGARQHLPKALKAVQLYARQEPLGEKGKAPPDFNIKDNRAMRSKITSAMRKLQPERERQDSQRSKGGKQANGKKPFESQEAMDDMAELAPKSAKRAATEPDSALAKFGTNLVEAAREGRLDPVIGREKEVERVLQILSRRTKNNVCLVGDPGVGKTAVAEAVAQCIADGKVPSQLASCEEVWSLDIGALLAGTGLRGDFEERLLDVLKQVKESRGAILLFIDELHLVLGAGRSESNNVDAANLMKPMLARGELRCIGATTTKEYRKLILSKDAAFERRFQVVELQEPSLAIAEEMLTGLVPLYAAHHGVEISPAVVKAAVALSHERIPRRKLPDKAIDVMDEACCVATGAGMSEVLPEHVLAVVERWSTPKGRAGLLPWLRLPRALRSRL
mmetsp:Transcript_46368/g.110415  ORF Transcript_46368/g.110415 Transcript_46368/m.110415 type:complete len:538 (-) Transcript_46368:110-1723(-)